MNQANSLKKVYVSDLWACICMFMIVMLSAYVTQFSVLWFGVYILLAIPLLKSLEHYFCLCFLLSTIPYYFLGATAQIYSVYTILALMVLFSLLINGRTKMYWNRNSFLLSIGLMIIAVISYRKSIFGYTNGMFQVIYIIAIPLFVCSLYQMDLKVIARALPQLATTMAIGYLLTVMITGGSFVGGRLTLPNDVNSNSFGTSCAQLATILFVSNYIRSHRSKLQLGVCLLVVVMALLSGSRGALLAFLAAAVIVVIIDAKRKNKLTTRVFGVLIVVGVLLVGLSVLISIFDLDAERFTLDAILSLGESTRGVIYESVIPYVINNGLWIWGYGPGHDCSRQIVNQLTGWDFSHTHNTYIEAFGEMGIGGLILTVVYSLKALFNINRVSKVSAEGYILLAVLLCMIIHGMAESFFCRISFWMLLALCRSIQPDRHDLERTISTIGE